jgi:hypothetical protein
VLELDLVLVAGLSFEIILLGILLLLFIALFDVRKAHAGGVSLDF